MQTVTPTVLRDMSRAFSALYRSAYDQAAIWYDKLATIVPSSSRENVYGWMGKLPRMREWVGPRIVNNLSAHTYTITNKHFEMTVGVDRDDIEDETLGIYNARMSEMAEQAKFYPQDLIVSLLENGHAALGYDGQNFFDTDHPTDANVAASGSQRNYWSTGMALDEANFITAWTAMTQFKGEDGRPLGVRPNLLVVPPALEITARKLVNATLVTNGGTNVLAGMVEVLVIPELTSSTAWYLFDTRRPIKPLVFQNRKQPNFVAMTSETDENVFSRREFLYGVDARGNAGYGPWFLAAKMVA